MRAVRNFLAGFAEIARKVRNQSATDDESLAFGCAYLTLGVVFLLLIFAAAFTCVIIWNHI
ncbi:MAG: hypothetical protein IJM04_04275 [Prevotella sp.]|nr:hypothetical protein [Prevotella sp.]